MAGRRAEGINGAAVAVESSSNAKRAIKRQSRAGRTDTPPAAKANCNSSASFFSSVFFLPSFLPSPLYEGQETKISLHPSIERERERERERLRAATKGLGSTLLVLNDVPVAYGGCRLSLGAEDRGFKLTDLRVLSQRFIFLSLVQSDPHASYKNDKGKLISVVQNCSNFGSLARPRMRWVSWVAGRSTSAASSQH